MPYTYDTLTSTITKYVVDTGSDFRELLPNIIENAVLLCGREASPLILDIVTTVTFTPTSTGDNVFTIPESITVIKSVQVTDTVTGRKRVLNNKPINVIQAYNANMSAAYDLPDMYGRLGSTKLMVAPYAPISGKYEIIHTAVSVPTATNIDSNLLTSFPDFVLAGCMVEAYLVKQDKDNAALWQLRYDRIRESIENESRRNRRDDTFTPNKLNKTGPNSLNGGN